LIPTSEHLLLLTIAAVLRWQQLPPLPDPHGVAGPFAGVADGALIVAGGANFPGGFPGTKVWHDDIFVLAKPTGRWQRAGKLPRPLGYGVSITTDRGLVCIGGNDAMRNYAGVFLVNRNGNVTPMPALPRPVANACGARIGNTLYVAGGEEKIFLAFDGKQWKELPPWPGCARILPQGAAADGAFYLAGGAELVDGKRRYLRDAFRYEPKTGWKQIANLPYPVVAAPALGGERMLIFGGDDGSKLGAQPHPGFLTTILEFDNGWRTAGQLPAARVTTPAVEWRGRIVIPSGEVRPGVRSPEVWVTR
jgi:N-acetylneuraminic acid mutarotase